MSDETYTIGGIEGRVAPPADLTLRLLVHTEPAPWAFRTAASLALCWQGKWPWGSRPSISGHSYDLASMGREVSRQLLTAGVCLDDYRKPALDAFTCCKDGVLRPSEVVAQADFTEGPPQDDGASTS